MKNRLFNVTYRGIAIRLPDKINNCGYRYMRILTLWYFVWPKINLFYINDK